MNEESHALIKMELKSVPAVDSSKNQSVDNVQEQDNTRPSTSNENAKKSKSQMGTERATKALDEVIHTMSNL